MLWLAAIRDVLRGFPDFNKSNFEFRFKFFNIIHCALTNKRVTSIIIVAKRNWNDWPNLKVTKEERK